MFCDVISEIVSIGRGRREYGLESGVDGVKARVTIS